MRGECPIRDGLFGRVGEAERHMAAIFTCKAANTILHAILYYMKTYPEHVKANK